MTTLKNDGVLYMPYGRKMPGTKGLYEIRTRYDRIMYCISGNVAYMLSGFPKKGNKTPMKELKLAKTRMRNLVV